MLFVDARHRAFQARIVLVLDGRATLAFLRIRPQRPIDELHRVVELREFHVAQHVRAVVLGEYAIEHVVVDGQIGVFLYFKIEITKRLLLLEKVKNKLSTNISNIPNAGEDGSLGKVEHTLDELVAVELHHLVHAFFFLDSIFYFGTVLAKFNRI